MTSRPQVCQPLTVDDGCIEEAMDMDDDHGLISSA